MTVGELIAALSVFDPDLPAVTRGFDESNIDDVGEVRSINVIFNAKSGGHTGPHLDANDTHLIAIYGKDRNLDEPRAAVLIDWTEA